MSRKISITSILSIALFCFVFFASSDASAQVRISVGGKTYDITANAGSFDTVQTNTGNALTNTATAPWFGASLTDTQAFAAAWIAAATISDLPSNSRLAFARALSFASATPDILYSGAQNSGTGALFTVFSASAVASDSTDDGFNLFYATAVEVPEINNSSLAQMLLVMFVGYLILRARRKLAEI